MAKAKNVTDGNGGFYGVKIECPGCGHSHVMNVTPSNGRPCWGFNHDYKKPTFTPSLLVRNGHYDPDWKQGDSCWCTYNAAHPEKPAPFECVICHSFITDGKIQFLNDCTHHLKGQTVDLPEVE